MADESKSGALKISSPEELQNWLESLPPEQGRWVAVAIAARLALRVLPLVAKDAKHKRGFKNWTFGVFFATAFARVPAVHPTRSNELRAFDGYGYVNNPAEHDALAAEVHEAGSSTSVYEAALDAVVAAKVAADDKLPWARASHTAYWATAAPWAAYYGDTAEAAQAALWAAASHDANFIASGGTAQTLASLPLWPSGTPDWARSNWKALQDALSRKDNESRLSKLFLGQSLQRLLSPEDDWQVWIDWYNHRLEGISDPEEVELAFATVPEKAINAGPAAANKWIKERLEELQKKESPPLPEPAPPLPQIPRQGPGPHVEIDTETGAVVPAKPESLDAEGNNLARLEAHHPRIVRHAGELLANLGQNEQPELFAAAKSYFDSVNRDRNQIDFERLWGEGVYLEEAEAAAARRIKDAMREPLNDAAVAALNALLRIHGPFILATKVGLENLADANAFETRPDEAKEQRAAAIELAQEFKANPDVVAPETAANFAHFAEQPESTKHPEHSSAFRMGMALNAAIVLTAGATIGVIIVEIGLATGNPIAGLGALPLVEGLKKSKPFLEVSGLVTEGLNKLSEEDARALWERLTSKIPFDRYRQFVLDNEALFRRLAGSGKQSRWLHEILDWLKRTTEPPK